MYLLFQKDWKEFPNAIPDLKTRNRSAVALALKLKAFGVKNHAFFLALLNPRLQGVDPYADDLTEEQMVWIGIECRTNPWYFFREVARAPAITGHDSNFVEFNRANICLWWSFLNHITIILTQPRQTGKSFCTDIMMTWLFNFACNNTQINLMTKDDKLRSENIARLKAIYEELPGYLQIKTRDDANNTEEISVKKLGNSYKTHVPQPSEKRAYNLGRGMTTPIFHIDEGPFQVNIEIALPAALAAMSAAIDSARASGSPYGIVFTTTAGKKDDKDGKYFYSIIQESAVWTEKFLDCDDEEHLRSVVIRNSRSNRNHAIPNAKEEFEGSYQVYACFSHRQLGKSDEWLAEILKRTRAKGDDANRDFFNLWTSGTQSSPLSPQVTDQLARSTVEPDCVMPSEVGHYNIRWYVPEDQIAEFMRTRKVICGVDTSEASGGDDIGLVFTDCQTGGVVAVSTCNETNLITFSKWLVSLLVKYDNLTMIIERRSTAATIVDYLLLFLPEHGIDPFKRLFNWIVNDPMENKERYQEATLVMQRRSEDTYVRAKKYFGFATSGGGATSRTELYTTTLQNAAKRFATRVHDVPLTQQITGLVTKNGRIDHADGEHDDLVIGWLLTHWFLTMAKNLNYYGIDSNKILTTTFAADANTQPVDRMQEQLQKLVRQRIDTVISMMRAVVDPVLIQRYEMELRALERQLILRDGESFSIDLVLKELHGNKGKRRRSYVAAHDGEDFDEAFGYATKIDRNVSMGQPGYYNSAVTVFH